MRGHDPERTAAAYLVGELSPRRRRVFEEHVLGCEECWGEVRFGRRGRALAESARELAPQPLRERIRGSVATVEPRGRRRRHLVVGASVASSVALAALLLLLLPGRQAQPPAVDALVAHSRGERTLGEPATPRLPRRLGDLVLGDVEAGVVDGIHVVAHRFTDPAGHVVTVYRADRPFPVAAGALRDRGGGTWHARVDGMELFCADRPFHALVAGEDRAEVRLAAASLGLR